jgi:hypothetical protein
VKVILGRPLGQEYRGCLEYVAYGSNLYVQSGKVIQLEDTDLETICTVQTTKRWDARTR